MGTDLLEDVVNMAVVEVLDRKNIVSSAGSHGVSSALISCALTQDTDISFFLSRPSTIENVCLFIFRNVGVIMRPHPFSCTQVEVEVAGCMRGPGSKGIHSTIATYTGEFDARCELIRAVSDPPRVPFSRASLR